MSFYFPTDPVATYKYSVSYEKLCLMSSKNVITAVILVHLDLNTR